MTERFTTNLSRISVVCLGNICRSPMAEVVLGERLRQAGLNGSVVVDSAGTGGWHVGEDMDERARRALEAAGYRPDRHRARRFEASWFGDLDLVLAMDEQNLARLRAMASRAVLESGRVRLFGSYGGVGPVPDPYGGEADGFTHVLGLIETAADELVTQILSGVRATRR